MQINAIISLIKSNVFEEAQNLLNKTQKRPEFADDAEFQNLFNNIHVFFLIKDKKYEEAIKELKSKNTNFNVLLRAQILLDLKKN